MELSSSLQHGTQWEVLVPSLNWLVLCGSLDIYVRCLVVLSEPSMIGCPQLQDWNSFTLSKLIHVCCEIRKQKLYDTCISLALTHLLYGPYANSKWGWAQLQELWRMKLLISSWNSRRRTNVTTYLGWHCVEQYGTYGTRNRRIFQHQSLCKIQLFRRLYEDINLTLRTYHWKEPDDPSDRAV